MIRASFKMKLKLGFEAAGKFYSLVNFIAW